MNITKKTHKRLVKGIIGQVFIPCQVLNSEIVTTVYPIETEKQLVLFRGNEIHPQAPTRFQTLC